MSSPEERRRYQDHLRNNQALWFLLLQATRGSAASIVGRYENGGNPNGREAWRELERLYGGREADERPVQHMTLEGKLRDMRCNSPEESSEFTMKARDHLALYPYPCDGVNIVIYDKANAQYPCIPWIGIESHMATCEA